MALRRTKNSSGLLDLDNGLGGGYILSKICLSMTLAVFGSNIVLAQVTPTIATPPSASAITYGQALSSSTLSGGVVMGTTPVVSTLAGSGTAGSADATGTGAQFNTLQGVAVDSSGNVYVADRSNHRIRKVTPAGVVSTLAGGTFGWHCRFCRCNRHGGAIQYSPRGSRRLFGQRLCGGPFQPPDPQGDTCGSRQHTGGRHFRVRRWNRHGGELPFS